MKDFTTFTRNGVIVTTGSFKLCHSNFLQEREHQSGMSAFMNVDVTLELKNEKNETLKKITIKSEINI